MPLWFRWKLYIREALLERKAQIAEFNTRKTKAIVCMIIIFVLSTHVTLVLRHERDRICSFLLYVIELKIIFVCSFNLAYHCIRNLVIAFTEKYKITTELKKLLGLSEEESLLFWKVPSEERPDKRLTLDKPPPTPYVHLYHGPLAYDPRDWLRRRNLRHLVGRPPGIFNPYAYSQVRPRYGSYEQSMSSQGFNLSDLTPRRSPYVTSNVPTPFYAKTYQHSQQRYPQREYGTPVEKDLPSTCSKNVWANLCVTQQQLDVWSTKLRQWIAGTILIRVVKAIEEINEKMMLLGYPDLQIGVLNIFSLKQLALVKADAFPTLESVVSYLEISLNQEYLVNRMKALAVGSCIREYNHDCGGAFAGSSWTKDLPTDSAIIMHIFCTYMDALLPFDKNVLEKKAFSNKYFKKVPFKPAFTKGSFYIYQSKTDPPYFSVIVDDEVYEVPKGRNNLFYAITLFLYYVKHKENCIVDT